MDHITIPIPDGLDDGRKADIAKWLTDLASQVTEGSTPLDDDPAAHGEGVRRVKRGVSEITAGRGVDGHEAMRRIAKKNGLSLPQ